MMLGHVLLDFKGRAQDPIASSLPCRENQGVYGTISYVAGKRDNCKLFAWVACPSVVFFLEGNHLHSEDEEPAGGLGTKLLLKPNHSYT